MYASFVSWRSFFHFLYLPPPRYHEGLFLFLMAWTKRYSRWYISIHSIYIYNACIYAVLFLLLVPSRAIRTNVIKTTLDFFFFILLFYFYSLIFFFFVLFFIFTFYTFPSASKRSSKFPSIGRDPISLTLLLSIETISLRNPPTPQNVQINVTDPLPSNLLVYPL